MALATCVSPASTVSELMEQGRESAAALESLLRGEAPPAHGGVRDLAAQILRCCDRALAALHGSGVEVNSAGAGGDARKRKSAPGGATAQARPKRRARASGGETPVRVEKKKTAEDGFIWRKYGQKEIQNSKYPRVYFRCTYKFDSGCRATRQVQQSEDDPSLYVITYFGDHTCCADAAAAAMDGDGKVQPFVINFGSATASCGGSPSWLSSSDDVVRSQTSHSSESQAVCLAPEEDREEILAKLSEVEIDWPPAVPAAELISSSDDVSCASPAFDSLPGCLDWYLYDESSFDIISELISFDEIPLFQ